MGPIKARGEEPVFPAHGSAEQRLSRDPELAGEQHETCDGGGDRKREVLPKARLRFG